MTASEETTPTLITPGPNAVDITPNQDGGVLKEIVKEGEGDDYPTLGCNVTVHYEGKLTDGTVFDSSRTKGNPFEFVVGKGIVIKAWDIGVTTMKKGEIAIFTCQPSYGYKDIQQGNIPPNSTLIFEVEMISWTHEDLTNDKNGGVVRLKTLVNGKSYSVPNEWAVCDVHLTGSYDGKVFEDRDVQFSLGEGCELGVVEGIELALTKFREGEKSVLQIKPKYAFKEEGNKELGVPPNATVEYTVELKSFQQLAKSWNMNADEKIAHAKIFKEKATNYFKANKYNMAIKLYNEITGYVNSDSAFDNETELESERKALLLATRLNLGLVYLKINDCYQARKECDKALEIDPENVKGLFRRGQAYLAMSEPEKAKVDFEAVLKIEPNNKLAASQVIACNNKMRQLREKEKEIYANMFEKFSKKDKEESTTRYGWWDDEKKEPVISETEPINMENVEEQKAEKKRQLERLKKLAQEKRELKEAEEKKAAEAKKAEQEKIEEEGESEKEVEHQPEKTDKKETDEEKSI